MILYKLCLELNETRMLKRMGKSKRTSKNKSEVESELIRVNLNQERNEIVDDITIKPISDIHLGDKLCNLKALKKGSTRDKR